MEIQGRSKAGVKGGAKAKVEVRVKGKGRAVVYSSLKAFGGLGERESRLGSTQRLPESSMDSLKAEEKNKLNPIQSGSIVRLIGGRVRAHRRREWAR